MVADDAVPALAGHADAASNDPTPDAWTIDITNDHGHRTYVLTDANGEERYAHEDQLPAWAVKALGPSWLADFASRSDQYYEWTRIGPSKDEAALDASQRANQEAWQAANRPALTDRRSRRALRATRRSPLEQRAALVAETVTYAGRLLDSLQREIAARSAIVQALADEVEASKTEAEHAAQLAQLNDQQARAVNAYLDRLLAARLDTMERHARRREWTLATIVALAVGVASILAAHFLVGF